MTLTRELIQKITPVNILVGASIIKELLDYSDDDIVEGLMLDIKKYGFDP